MEFRKYNSIENTYQKSVIEQLFIHEYDKLEYVVQEKVHGANFAFYTDGLEVKIAKRSDFINENEAFYNAKHVAEKYHGKIKSLFHTIKEEFPNTQFITVFGELFGGGYNHKDVPKVMGSIQVQKGVFYTPENEFYAFDIKLNGEFYLTVTQANKYFEAHEFFYAKTLFHGSLEDALNYPNTFDSLIPSWFGLPEIENNVCEGTIIKPVEPKFFNGGSRVILKNKNEKWAENEKNNKPNKEFVDVELPKNAQEIWNEIQNFITPNRLNNVLSKEGEFQPKMMGKLIGWMSQDVLTDYKKLNDNKLESLEKENVKNINKRLNTRIISLIKEELMTFK